MRFVPFSGDAPPCGPSKALINKNIRTTDNPCGWYCTFPDFKDWKWAARQAVIETLTGRPDLPEPVQAQLKTLALEVEQMPEEWVGKTANVQRLANIHQFATCIATWDPAKSDPPNPPKEPAKDDPGQMDPTSLIWAGATLIGVVLLWKTFAK